MKRENHRKGSVVNVNPTNIRPQSDTPEIRKYKKKFNAEVLCAGLWGSYFILFEYKYLSLKVIYCSVGLFCVSIYCRCDVSLYYLYCFQ